MTRIESRRQAPASQMQKDSRDNGTSGWFPVDMVAQPHPGNDGQWDGDNLEIRMTANESGLSRYLPGTRMFDIGDVNPKMKIREVLDRRRDLKKVIKAMRSKGLYVLPIVVYGGLLLKSAAHPDLLGHIDDKRSLRKPMGKAKELVGSIRGKFKTKRKPTKFYPFDK